MPVEPVHSQGYSFSRGGLYLPDTAVRAAATAVLDRYTLQLHFTNASRWEPLTERRGWAMDCDAEDCGYRPGSLRMHTTLAGANADIKQQWRQRANEAHEMSHRLAGFGLNTAAQEAQNSSRNFWLVGSLIENLEIQPVYVHEAFAGFAGILASVYTIADAGYTFLRAYVRLRAADLARTRRRHIAALLAKAITRARENLESLIARRQANDRTLHDANPPDAPYRALPRETRAGPASKEPSEPAHKPYGCERGEARSIRPATSRSRPGATQCRPSADMALPSVKADTHA
jgi:hypothetical protein